jgi:hypothetical protein
VGAGVTACAALVALPSWGGGAGEAVSFRADIQPIFDRKCVSCHPAAYPYLDLRPGRAYGQLVRVPAATAPSYERVVPGRPGLSYLLIHPPDPSRMTLLGRAERALIARWIRQGARDN